MPNADHGFTLIEVLVALVVTALLLAILLEGVETTRHLKQTNLERVEATRLSRSILAGLAGTNQPFAQREGNEAGLHWIVSERPLITDPRGFYQLVEIRIDVTDKDAHRVQSFVTRKLRKGSGL
ncbi:type IV pilus modification PilV family protein [Rhizorhabdus wittichii]|uniref:type IV pilus modification PilV family protein n=1 Tax=Rhizorhabdus wittichii TaxID=160791 RepID=UPI0003740E31|nr:prepilin-type N-terminal cleavage/methylation domain-containing protein [Rhizorhabdus wittichii]